MKINKNIIAKDLDSPLQLIEIEIEDSYITGEVLVGSGSYVKGKVYKMPYINFVLTSERVFSKEEEKLIFKQSAKFNEAKNMSEIKVGTKLIACYNLQLGDKIHLTNLKEYEVKRIDDFNETFIIIDDQNEDHIFNYSDIPNVWFNFYKPKKDPIVKQVTDKFKQRSRVGIEKYGTTLAENELSLDEWLNHAIEEQMDNILYLTKLREELKKKGVK